MHNFWGLYDNGTYRVGCNGTTIYVLDQENRELAKFKDIAYAYHGAFQPNTNRFIAKSIEGKLAVYDLDRLTLMKKISITRIGAQDEGFAFRPDGMFFYNIEKPKSELVTRLVIYDTRDYSIKRALFDHQTQMHLEDLEFDSNHTCYLLGYMRDEDRLYDYGFIATLIDDELQQIKKLSEAQYHSVRDYYHWKRSGFTAKALERSTLKDDEHRPSITLKALFDP